MHPTPTRQAPQAPASTFQEERDWPGLIALYVIAAAVTVAVSAVWPEAWF